MENVTTARGKYRIGRIFHSTDGKGNDIYTKCYAHYWNYGYWISAFIEVKVTKQIIKRSKLGH